MAEYVEQRAAQVARIISDQCLVEEAERIVRGNPEKFAKDDRRGEGGSAQVRSQISRAADAAERSPSPKVFDAWVRYQWAREVELWRIPLSAGSGPPEDVAHRILRVMRQFQKQIDTDPAGAALPPEVRDRAVMKATARFLGFLRRAAVGVAWQEGIEQR